MDTFLHVVTDFFGVPLWQGLVGNAIAVALGIPAGLYLNNLIASRSKKEQKDQLQAALRGAIEHNLEILSKISRAIALQEAPTLNLDVALLEATAERKYDVLDDVELCAIIDRLRYEMAQVNRHLDAFLNMALDVSGKGKKFRIEGGPPFDLFGVFSATMVKMIGTELPPLEGRCREILQRLPAIPN